MASKRRLRRKACDGKKRHKTLDGAKTAVAKCQYQGVHAYKCGFCNGYHIGHRPDKIRKSIEYSKMY